MNPLLQRMPEIVHIGGLLLVGSVFSAVAVFALLVVVGRSRGWIEK